MRTFVSRDDLRPDDDFFVTVFDGGETLEAALVGIAECARVGVASRSISPPSLRRPGVGSVWGESFFVENPAPEIPLRTC